MKNISCIEKEKLNDDWHNIILETKNHSELLFKIYNNTFGSSAALRYHDLVIKINDKLIKKGYKREELDKFASYHVFIGGTPMKSFSPETDLPGQDSILEMIKSEINQHINRQISISSNRTNIKNII